MSTDLHFKGQEYSLLLLLFYIPNGLCDLPLNMLTKKYSGRYMLSGLMFGWGALSMIQVACKGFGSLLVIRLLIGALEAGFFAGTVFYMTLFYTRGELGFRIAIYFGSALLAAAFSGLISFGVFHIEGTALKGWQYLFIIEGALTVVFAVGGFWWLPESPQTAWFLNQEGREAARSRLLRDGSQSVGVEFSIKECFSTWNDWKFIIWCIIAFTYPVAFSTCSNFLPLILKRLGYSTVVTNLLTVPPNFCGFLVLLAVTYNSDRTRERTFHIIGALTLSMVGLIILAAINAEASRGAAYFATFLVASGAYIPSCLVHSWHNNNNVNENSRAATTGLLVGLSNFGGILSSATFRTNYAPRYLPTLIATACCNATCIIFTLWLGTWMRQENKRRNEAQGVVLHAEDVDTNQIEGGEKDPRWRYFV
jgi:MFS family permease